MHFHGIPTSPETIIKNIFERVESLILYLQIPSHIEFYNALRDAAQDSISAIKSISYFFFLIIRPLVLLCNLIFQFISPYLQILFKYTLRYAWIVLRRFCLDFKAGVIQFVKFQRSLSRGAVIMEISFILIMIGLYFLRRYIKRKKYVERISKWCSNKKRFMLRKYENFLKRVSETSVLFALSFPHILYVLFCINLKYMLSDVVRFLITKTLLLDILMVWFPLYQTVYLLSIKYVSKTTQRIEPPKGNDDEQRKKEMKKTEEKSAKAKSSVAMRYLQATSSNKSTVSTDKSSANKSTTTSTSKAEENLSKNESEITTTLKLKSESLALLRYWVIFSLCMSIFELLQIIPFIQTIFSPIISRISQDFMKEILTFFWIWLKYLPLGSDTHSKQWMGKSPTIMIFSQLSPLALYFENRASKAASSQLSATVYQKFSSFLEIAVFFRLISQKTKELILVLSTDSQLLLPGAITIGMPSTFTRYGCIYIRSVVPSINSIQNCEDVEKRRAKTNDLKRWLKYWVIQYLAQLALSSSLIPFWLPFQTHFALLVWLYLNLPLEKWAGASFVYELLEYEFIGFGILPASSKEHENIDIQDTYTARAVSIVLKHLPSSVTDSEKQSESSQGNNASSTAVEKPVKTKENGSSNAHPQMNASKTESKTSQAMEAPKAAVDSPKVTTKISKPTISASSKKESKVKATEKISQINAASENNATSLSNQKNNVESKSEHTVPAVELKGVSNDFTSEEKKEVSSEKDSVVKTSKEETSEINSTPATSKVCTSALEKKVDDKLESTVSEIKVNGASENLRSKGNVELNESKTNEGADASFLPISRDESNTANENN